MTVSVRDTALQLFESVGHRVHHVASIFLVSMFLLLRIIDCLIYIRVKETIVWDCLQYYNMAVDGCKNTK